jgi:deazaflavin-dependent oxidoreductase (nitroreductase family)
MGLASDLGYVYRPPNPVQRAGQAFGSTRPGAWLFSKTLATLDHFVHRLSRGRTSLPQLLAGLPVIMVTTTGRKSGAARTTPLIAPPVGDDLALVGTNFGQTKTPAWVLNLEADPRATVEYRGRSVDVMARPADDEERHAVWGAASAVYGGYDKYQQRITGRTVRIFVLEPAQTPLPRVTSATGQPSSAGSDLTTPTHRSPGGESNS